MSKENNTKKEIGYTLKGIEILEIQLKHPNKTIPKETLFNFNMSFEHRFNIENQLIFVVFTAKILMENEIEVGSFKISYTFSITNFETFVNANKILEIPQNVAQILNSIAISTSRGVLYSHLNGTFLHNVLLPLINPANIALNKKITDTQNDTQ